MKIELKSISKILTNCDVTLIVTSDFGDTALVTISMPFNDNMTLAEVLAEAARRFTALAQSP